MKRLLLALLVGCGGAQSYSVEFDADSAAGGRRTTRDATSSDAQGGVAPDALTPLPDTRAPNDVAQPPDQSAPSQPDGPSNNGWCGVCNPTTQAQGQCPGQSDYCGWSSGAATCLPVEYLIFRDGDPSKPLIERTIGQYCTPGVDFCVPGSMCARQEQAMRCRKHCLSDKDCGNRAGACELLYQCAMDNTTKTGLCIEP